MLVFENRIFISGWHSDILNRFSGIQTIHVTFIHKKRDVNVKLIH